ncbi:MAG TPA: Gfo/Idh/MocA family oxidoreductase [Candidatus Limnocylindrales bacterium]
MNDERLRIGIVGAGDVAHRHYLPGLRSRADRVRLAAVADPRDGAGEGVAAAAADWSPGARVFATVEDMLVAGGLDGVVNLTPATRHGAVNRLVLEAGTACYSEKPIASTVAEADELIDLAAAKGVLLLCAPGSAVTQRIRWLRELASSGRLGSPTLAVAHHADPGPADWAEYTGDPTPFYREGVGPVFDHGVYRLHEMTTVMGPVRRVQAMGSIALPVREIRGGPKTGGRIEVTTQDHVLVHLEFASGALGQLLASFATADTLQPWLELHLERGVVSFAGKSWDLAVPVSILDISSEATREAGWRAATEAPVDDVGAVEAGIRHFAACLAGEETPVLTAEHARHVLEIILAAYASMADGRTHDLGTTFGDR